LSDQQDLLDVVMVNGRRLTEAQLSRRRFNLGLLASGAFAALAGVRSLASGLGDPCAEAVRVAGAARARLVACARLADGSLEVVAEVALPRLLARWPHMPPARARARAGGRGGAAVASSFRGRAGYRQLGLIGSAGGSGVRSR